MGQSIGVLLVKEGGCISELFPVPLQNLELSTHMQIKD
jgi:hypothetical protein